MNINNRKNVPKGSVAILKPTDLLGSKAVVIQKGDSREYVESGDEIEGKYIEGMMSTFKEKGEKLGGDISNSFDHFNRLMEQLNKVVDDPNRSELQATLKNLRRSTERIARIFENKEREITGSIDHAQNFLQKIDTLSTVREEEVKNTIENLEKASRELKYLTSDMRETNTELDNLLKKINDGEGSIGRMVNDPSLYQNLDTLAINLKNLSRDFNEKPERFLQYMRMVEIF
jgi:ABC-type transporter Mla subunit MlaD